MEPDHALGDAQVAVIAAAAGAAVLRRRYGDTGRRFDKGAGDFATEADLESEAAVREVIAGHRPEDGFVGEETGASGEGLRAWLVDPLCGTRNLAAGTPLGSVNVALREGDDVRVAAVAEPLLDGIWWTDGDAAYGAGGAALVPSAESALVDVNLDYHRKLDPGRPWPLRLLADPGFAGRFGPRVLSSTLALAWVASGSRAAYITDGSDLLTSVHFAAGIAICRAAGCVVTGLLGQPLDESPGGLLAAADADTHAILLAQVRRAYGGAGPFD